MAKGRPKLVERPVRTEINMPEGLRTRVDLLLFSELEQCVPHGALSKYINDLVARDLQRRANAKGE